MMINEKNVLHCTAKFCGFQKFKSKDSNENSKHKEYVNKVQEHLGQVQRLKIIGFFFTKETMGARIELTEEQLKNYDQDEKLSSQSQRQYGKPPKSQENRDDFKESVTIQDEDQAFSRENERFKPFSKGQKGLRAHITIATAPSVRPVNTGIDLMEIVQAEHNCDDENDSIFEIPDSKDVLKQYKDHFWVVYLNDALTVESIFTGYY